MIFVAGAKGEIMSEYIDREKVILVVRHAWAKGLEPTQYIERIPAADVAPVEWHAIEDCLPDVHLTRKICERVGVLVVVSDGGVRRTRFRSYERADVRGKTVCRWKYPRDRISHEHITHWAYLPEPPKEETDELD